MRRSDVLVSLSLRFRGDTLPPTSTMFAAERGRDFGARGDSRQGDCGHVVDRLTLRPIACDRR